MTKIFIKTFGCSLNKADSETMAGVLKRDGFTLVDSYNNANVVIINSCTKTRQDDSEFFSYYGKMKDLGKKIIAAGCLVQSNSKRIRGVSQIGVNQLEHISALVEETLHGEAVTLVARGDQDIMLPTVRKSKLVEIIPINEGCLGHCTFCAVKESRGGLRSHDPKVIRRRVEEAVKEGAKQIWLESMDTSCYGREIECDLPTLVKILADLPGKFRVRIGMMNPMFKLDKLIEVLKHPKVFKYLHIPIQSGNNKILREMKRDYTNEDTTSMIESIKKDIPELTFETDVIAGFPGETVEQFMETSELVKKLKPDVLNVHGYTVRKGTPASNVAAQTIQERVNFLKEMHAWTARIKNKQWKGRICNVIIEDIGKDNTFIGYNESYKKVVIPNNGRFSIGDFIKAEIVGSTDTFLQGKFIEIC